MRFLNAIFLVFLSVIASAQLTEEEQRAVDSLKNIVETTNSDTSRIIALNYWDNIIYISDPQLDYEINKRIEAICERNLQNQSSIDEKSLLFFMRNYAACLNILGLIYQDQGDYQSSIAYHYKSLSCCEDMQDSLCMSRSYNNIGLLHSVQNNYNEALKYYFKKVDLEERLGNQKSLSLVYSNIGRVYFNMDSLRKANEFYNKSLRIRETLGFESLIADSYNEIAMLYQKQKKYDSLLFFYNKSLSVYEDIGYARGVSSVNVNIGNYYMSVNQHKKALPFLEKAYRIDTSTKVYEDLANSTKSLYELYQSLGDYKNALTFYQQNMDVKDTIYNNKNAKAMIQQQFRHEYDKKKAADSITMLNKELLMGAELEAKEAEAKRQEEQKYFIFGGLCLSIVFVGFIFNRFRVAKKQKEMIQHQQDQILESINYSKQIQDALLPHEGDISNDFFNAFVFFQPKDIVSGDFYWHQKINNKSIIACADCTGHGVPGGFMSTLSSLLIDKVVREGLNSEEVLLLLSDEIIRVLQQEKDDSIQDGMDISVLIIDRQQKTVEFSGARNGLIQISGNEITRHKASLLPVGGNYLKKGKPIQRKFPVKNISIKEGDWLFMYTDGYMEQTGGKEDVPMNFNQFQEVLKTVSVISSNDERTAALQKEFDNWRGDQEVVDDVLIIGLQFRDHTSI